MSTSRRIPAASTSGRVRGAGVQASAHGDEAVVQAAYLDESSRTFEDFLAEMSSAMSTVAPSHIENEIRRWLDQLAQQLGAERCTIGEFYGPKERPRFLLQWKVGGSPQPFMRDSDAWIQGRLALGQLISISSLDELPAEAASARELLEEMRIRSGLWVPMLVEGSAVGGIGLLMMSRGRAWPTQIIQRCQLVADVIGNALMRRRNIAEIEEREQFESLVTDILARFMNVGSDIDPLTDEVLAELGEFLKVDRFGYLEVDAQKRSLTPTRLWIAEGIKDNYPVQYEDVSAQFQWLAGKVIAGEPVTVSQLDKFPEEAKNEKQYCEILGIQSFAMVPAKMGDVAVAALVLEDHRESRVWDSSILHRLQIVAGIIASAQARARAQRAIDELRSLGLSVPQDVSVIGFDNSIVADLFNLTNNGGVFTKRIAFTHIKALLRTFRVNHDHHLALIGDRENIKAKHLSSGPDFGVVAFADERGRVVIARLPTRRGREQWRSRYRMHGAIGAPPGAASRIGRVPRVTGGGVVVIGQVLR